VNNLNYRINRPIDLEDDYGHLLFSLTKDELNKIRKNWGFKGISNLNKKELASELQKRIPVSVNRWLKLIDESIYFLLKELLTHGGMGIFDIQSEGDLRFLKYLQERGVLFYGVNQGELLLLIPGEIKKEIQKHLDSNPDLIAKIEENTDLILYTIGILVYYGIYPSNKIFRKIERHIDYEIDVLEYLDIIFEFSKAYDIIYRYQNNFVLEYVRDLKWLMKEQDKRSELNYYEMVREELIYAGKNILPLPGSEYRELEKYLKKNDVSKEIIKEIMSRLYFDINNGISYPQMVSIIIELVDFETQRELKELSEHLLSVYNNTRQWILKGNTPNKINVFKSTTIDREKNNVVSLDEFRKKRMEGPAR